MKTAAVFALIVCALSLADQSSALLGFSKKKTPTVYKYQPWQVKISVKHGFQFKVCAGSLISNRWVVSSARCLENTKSALVSLGLNKVPPLGINATTIVYHPKFNYNNFNNDIALLKLSAAVSNSNIKPINLPTYSQNSTSFVNNLTYIDDMTPNKVNKSTNQRVISNIECTHFYNANNVVATTLCTRNYENPLNSTCEVAAGSALTLNEKGTFKQIGIASFTSKNSCKHGAPIGFTRLSSYLGWISTVTGITIKR